VLVTAPNLGLNDCLGVEGKGVYFAFLQAPPAVPPIRKSAYYAKETSTLRQGYLDGKTLRLAKTA